MDRSVFLAMSGAKQTWLAQSIHANNLANVNTTGFRADLEQARAMPVYGEHFPSRVYAMTERPATDFSAGSLIETGRNLDIAVNGEGWITVLDKNGNEALTRAGNLQIDAAGFLVTANGYRVSGDGGEITLPPAEKVTIGTDGTISVQVQGQGPETLSQVARIKLVNPDPATLYKDTDGLVRSRNNEPFEGDAFVSVVSGFIEGSNVNAVAEMTQMISLARQFELQVKMMQNISDNEESSARILQLS